MVLEIIQQKFPMALGIIAISLQWHWNNVYICACFYIMNEELIKQALIDQRSRILSKNMGTEREALNVVTQKASLPHVQVITGLRRVGKSTLLRQIIKSLYDDKHFFYINFDDERLLNFDAQDFGKIIEFLTEIYGPQKTILIDEIQNVQGFQLFVRRLSDDGYKFFITGSNSNLMSREIGTKLTGRHIDIELSPFSFAEFLRFHHLEPSTEDLYKTETRSKIKELFTTFLLKGGMPEYCIYDDSEVLQRTYEDIVIKDIAVRYKIADIMALRELYQYLITNFCRPFTYNSLKKFIDIKNSSTIRNYVDYLVGSFFISILNRYKSSVKEQIRSPKKVYVIDNGFFPVLSLSPCLDKGWLLENLVFNQLNREFDLAYHLENKECDFICMKNRKVVMVVQVCFELNVYNRERELNGIIEAMNFHKLETGLLLTYNQSESIEVAEATVSIKPVWKWLLEKKEFFLKG
ncbi:MAG: ATP-binding protein [Prolixibacteraceae bacterium]|nr:ATP-binding protein [Prolixibacteraceae bacterium]